MERLAHCPRQCVGCISLARWCRPRSIYITHVRTLFTAILLPPDSVRVVPFTHYTVLGDFTYLSEYSVLRWKERALMYMYVHYCELTRRCHALQVARASYTTTKGRQSATLARDFLDEYKKVSDASWEIRNRDCMSHLAYFQSVLSYSIWTLINYFSNAFAFCWVF